MNPNELAQWLAVYDQNIGRRGSNNYASGASPWGTMVGRDDDANYAGGRLLWAMDAMQRQGEGRREHPNFFANLPGDNEMQPRQQFGGMRPQMQPDPMRQPANNYLMKLLGGR